MTANHCDRRILVFIHAVSFGAGPRILAEQLARLKSSGLFDAAEDVRVGLVGEPIRVPAPKRSPVFYLGDAQRYEFPTLQWLHTICQEDLSIDHLCYFHVKGVTHPGNPCVADWRELMEYFIIDRWQECVNALATNDAAGVNWQDWPNHFSGNFWWASGEYIRTLPPPALLPTDDRGAAEAWIGSGRPRVFCPHSSERNHYYERYPSSLYKA